MENVSVWLCHQHNFFSFDQTIIKFTDAWDRHKILDKLKSWPDSILDVAVMFLNAENANWHRLAIQDHHGFIIVCMQFDGKKWHLHFQTAFNNWLDNANNQFHPWVNIFCTQYIPYEYFRGYGYWLVWSFCLTFYMKYTDRF